MKYTIQEIPMKDIKADFAWNARRSIGDESSGGPEDENSVGEFKELKASLAVSGQDTPVIVRPVKGGKYFLVCGYRRFKALEKLYAETREVPNLAKGAIRCEVREMSDSEARELNGRENLTRENLNPADTAFVVSDLARARKTQMEIGLSLGLSQGYVGKLLMIQKMASQVPAGQDEKGNPLTAFDIWRSRPGTAKVLDMYGAAKDTEQRPEDGVKIFGELLNVKPPTEAEKRTAKLRAIAKKAAIFCIQLSRLKEAGLITMNTTDWTAIVSKSKVMKKLPAEPKDLADLSKMITGIMSDVMSKGDSDGDSDDSDDADDALDADAAN